MTVAVSRAKGRGAEAVICASTGNTAASAAAYAARAGMRGAVIVPEGKIAIGKLAQSVTVTFREGKPFVEPEESERTVFGEVFDHEDHVVEAADHVVGQRIEGICDEFFEGVGIHLHHRQVTTAPAYPGTRRPVYQAIPCSPPHLGRWWG